MHVLAISGSPSRAGNTAFLLGECLAGAQEAGASGALIHLNALDYRGCQGCNACKRSGRCVLMDGLEGVLEQIQGADAVVFGSPVYGWCVSSQLKACMDRLYAQLDLQGRSRLPRSRRAALVASQATPDEGAYLPSLEAATRALGLLFVDPELLVFGNLGSHGDAAQRPELAQRARDLGRRLAQG